MAFDVTSNTPQGLYKQTRASIVNVVSEDGQRGILPNHMPIVVSLAVGKMTMEEESGRETYAVSGGVLFFRNNQCTILTPAIENVKDIDLDRAQKAKERAEERLKRVNDEHVDFARAQVALQRAINRINVKQDMR